MTAFACALCGCEVEAGELPCAPEGAECPLAQDPVGKADTPNPRGSTQEREG